MRQDIPPVFLFVVGSTVSVLMIGFGLGFISWGEKNSRITDAPAGPAGYSASAFQVAFFLDYYPDRKIPAYRFFCMENINLNK